MFYNFVSNLMILTIFFTLKNIFESCKINLTYIFLKNNKLNSYDINFSLIAMIIINLTNLIIY